MLVVVTGVVVVAVQITFPETAPIIVFLLADADLQKQFPQDCPDCGTNVK